MFEVYVGIDIAAKSLSIYWQDIRTEQTGQMTLAQSPSDFKRLHQTLSQIVATEHIHIVMEATGNYWLKLALYLHEQGYCVSVINPMQAKRFGQMQLKRTKTDAVDAQLLSDFARLIRPEPWTPSPAICHQLRHLLERRDDVLKMATQERNRLHALQHDPHAPTAILSQIKRHVATLKRQAKQLLAQIEALLASDSQWQQAAQHLLSIPGIGTVTAAWLLVTTHAFTRCDTPQQAAAYAGLVPHHRQSGRSLHKRSTIGGGHPKLRQALYMAAGAAIQFNPTLKAFFNKKVDQGKIKQVARIAVARKLIHLAWACVVKHRDYNPVYPLLTHVA